MKGLTEYQSQKLIDSNATVHIFHDEKNSIVPLHIHDFIEIVYVLAGTSEQYVNEQRYDVRRGDVLFINYGAEHYFVPSEDFKYVNICFDPDSLGMEAGIKDKVFSSLQLDAFNEMRCDIDSGKLHFSGKEREHVEMILEKMEIEYSRKARGWCDVLKSYLNVFFIYLLRNVEGAAEYDEQSDLWEKVFKYIDDNISEDLTLSFLAKKCFYNPSYFSRVFKEKVGMTFSKYLSTRRVERAISILNDGGRPDEVAETVGFASKSALYRAFLREKGLSLSDYRKM